MNATIVGIERQEYYSQKKGREVKGLTFHYTMEKPSCVGLVAASMWIESPSAVYDSILAIDMRGGPVAVDIENPIFPGDKFPTLVSVKVLNPGKPGEKAPDAKAG